MTSTTRFVRRWQWLRRWWPLVGLGLAMLVVVAFLSLRLWILVGARDLGTAAMGEYPGDRVQALMAFVDSDRHSLDERNRAVWALGQLGDRRALPVVKKYYTGAPCDHARYLCQYELQKAIRSIERQSFDPMRLLVGDAFRR